MYQLHGKYLTGSQCVQNAPHTKNGAEALRLWRKSAQGLPFLCSCRKEVAITSTEPMHVQRTYLGSTTRLNDPRFENWKRTILVQVLALQEPPPSLPSINPHSISPQNEHISTYPWNEPPAWVWSSVPSSPSHCPPQQNSWWLNSIWSSFSSAFEPPCFLVF